MLGSIGRFFAFIIWVLVFIAIVYFGLRLAYVEPRLRAAGRADREAVREAMQPYAAPTLVGSLALAIVLKALGLLPGASRRPAAPATEDSPAREQCGIVGGG
jgi:hypothetical protein